MPKQTAKGNPRVNDQAEIAHRFGWPRLEEAKTRLCKCCIWHIRHGRPCHLLPITLEGHDCPYHTANQDQYGEVIWNE